ncbi:MAG: monovalent cation/H(+) antiporter subunit G [Fimbriimonadaceae bacterium]|nr:monovalent cation/H(+) antiporter subunit G [Fimbriimonadaceae bacterium]
MKLLDVVAGVSLILGSALMLISAFGVLLLPDLYTRMQASTKASTLGLGLILAGVAIAFGGEVGMRVALVGTFFLMTQPIGAHMLGRAGYLSGVPLWSGSVVDALEGKFDPPVVSQHAHDRWADNDSEQPEPEPYDRFDDT